MKTESLVSINITYQDTLLNVNKFPILLYWDGNGEINNVIVSDKNFYEFVKIKCFNSEKYAQSQIDYFYFEIDKDNNEVYKAYSEKIQNLFKLSNINEDSKFYIQYIKDIFNNLYYNALKKRYEQTNEISLSEEDYIISMYKEIQQKFPQRFIKESVINYLRSELIKTYYLSEENTSWIIDQITKILINET